MEDKLKEFIKRNRQEFDKQQPKPEVWTRIASRIPTVAHDTSKSLSRIWYVAAAIGLVLLVGTVWVMSDVDNGSVQLQVAIPAEEQQITNKSNSQQSELVNALPDEEEQRQEKPAYEVGANEKAVVLKAAFSTPLKRKDQSRAGQPLEDLVIVQLADSVSAANRLSAVLSIGERIEVDETILETLERVINTDPNSNVRIAAWEVLIAKTPDAEQLDKLIDVFDKQEDPILQLELLHLMATADNVTVREETLERLLQLIDDPWATADAKEQVLVVLMKNVKYEFL